jgi:hypothetical protein
MIIHRLILLPTPNCAQYGTLYLANLQTRAVAQAAQCVSDIVGVDSTAGGNYTAIGNAPCLYSAQTASYTIANWRYANGNAAISADGNVVAEYETFGTLGLLTLGVTAHPLALYGNPITPVAPLLRPRLNASGSLYYLAYPTYFEIVDVSTPPCACASPSRRRFRIRPVQSSSTRPVDTSTC